MEMHEEMGGGKEEKMNDKVKDYPPYLDYPKERKPMTIADRIRAMTDEELAEWINNTLVSPYYYLTTAEAWLRWLKQEADG